VDYQVKLAALDKEVDARFGAIFQGQMPSVNDEISMSNIRAATTYLEQYDQVLAQANLTTAKTPYETNRRLMLLQQLREVANDALRKYRADTQAVRAELQDDPMDAEFNNAMIERWPANDALYRIATDVMASRNHNIRNQRQYDAQLRAKSAEVETLKRDRETYELQTKQQGEKLQDMERRLKAFEASTATAAAASHVTPLAATAAASTTVDVGASRGTAIPTPSSNSKLAQVYMDNALLSALSQGVRPAYTPGSDARVEKMLNGMNQYMGNGGKQQRMFKIKDA
jgi:hypothetical protein